MRRKVAKILDMQAAEIDPHTYKREGRRRVCIVGLLACLFFAAAGG